MNNTNMRFGFGKNWKQYVEKNFSEERVQISKNIMLEFLGMEDLKGKHFLDVGCGSGLHSLAALRSGAARVVGFDFDPNSVSTTQMLKEYAGNPQNWKVMQGSILDPQFLKTLDPADIVYAWGVLHHTGDLWQAVENTAGLVKKGGLLYLALYTSGVTHPSDEFWLAVKQKYNRSGWLAKRKLELWYVWEFMLQKKLRSLPDLIKTARKYKHDRGMALYTDIVDWLGGWPMEFSTIEQVKSFCGGKLNMTLINLKTGQANTNYLFRKE